MTDSVSYECNDRVATIRIDDGKRNALSPSVLDQIYAAFDRAESDRAVVILTGREDVFSAGFDLNVMKKGGGAAIGMLKRGYGLPARILNYPYPVIAACNGHSLAMGVFMMLAADYTIGSRGDYKIAANEVAIGMTMPRVAAAMLEHRLQPAAYQRAITVSNFFDPESAKDAGFFDALVEPAALMDHAGAIATLCQSLDEHAHKVSKRRIRKRLVRRIRRQRWLDLWDAGMVGLRRARKS
ncbi:MAG: crotonase/enoyl-CoA hydratase family protein [Pseudomonadota bacterium]